MGADAFDATRMARIPGSRNSKSGSFVRYNTTLRADGTGYSYTLGSLATELNVESPCNPRPSRTSTNPVFSARALKGYHAQQRNRLENFQRLWSIRGGFSDGCRNRAAYLYAMFLRRSGANQTNLSTQLERLAESCSPPLRGWSIRGAIKSSRSRRGNLPIRNQTIADWLDVTPSESMQLANWPSASRFGATPLVVKPTRSDIRQARRRAIQEILTTGRSIPSVRRLSALLADRFGIAAVAPTIARDLIAMNFRPNNDTPELWVETHSKKVPVSFPSH